MAHSADANEQGPWVLIVEDDPFLNKIYGTRFSEDGVLVKIAEDGEEAFALLETGELPAVMLLDLVLPKKSGLEVLAALKSDPRLKAIPVIVLTNLDQAADADEAFKLGAADYLVKANTDIEEVVTRVKRYVGQ